MYRAREIPGKVDNVVYNVLVIQAERLVLYKSGDEQGNTLSTIVSGYTAHEGLSTYHYSFAHRL